MITLRDVNEEVYKDFETVQESINFSEKYDQPNSLLKVSKWFCDGAGWNRRLSRICYGTEGKELIVNFPKEEHTNNYMEYLAVYRAMQECAKYDVIVTDSQLVVNQLNGKWMCNFEHLFKITAKCKKLKESKCLIVDWIPRRENKAGRILEKTK